MLRVSSNPIPKYIRPYGEPILNRNGERLREYVIYNDIRITNEFFRKKDFHKYNWSVTGSVDQ